MVMDYQKRTVRTWVVGLEPTAFSTGVHAKTTGPSQRPLSSEVKKIPGFRVYKHDAEISCRYYHIGFSIENKFHVVSRKSAGVKRKYRSRKHQKLVFGVVGTRTPHLWNPYQCSTPTLQSTSENEEGLLMYNLSIKIKSGRCRKLQNF
jgi:hypothetical protein